MSQLNLAISTRRDDNTLKAMFETPGTSPNRETGNRLINFLTSVITGTELGPSGAAPTIAISIQGQATAASGTLTVATGGSANNQAGSVAGVAITGKSSGAVPANGEFNVSAVAATQATNMAATINATTALAGIVTATSALGVVTITSAVKGVIGNGLALAEGDLANVTKSGALLTAGAADATAKTLSF